MVNSHEIPLVSYHTRFLIFCITVSLASATLSADDKSVIRSILDSNNLHSIQVDDVATFENNRATRLNLAGRNLTVLPEKIGQLTELKLLIIDNNYLTRLPDSIQQLTKLTGLFAYSNDIGSIPGGIGKLTNLTELNLNDNKIAALPNAMGELSSLKSLYLDDNILSNIPEALGKLTQLEILSASKNIIATLPVSLSQMTGLRTLLLEQNRIARLPSQIDELTKLLELNLNKNRLYFLPDDLNGLSQLKRCMLSNNGLTELPESFGTLTSLEKLWLNNNELADLPESIADLDISYQRTPSDQKEYWLDVSVNRICNTTSKVTRWLDVHDPDWTNTQDCSQPVRRRRIADLNAGIHIVSHEPHILEVHYRLSAAGQVRVSAFRPHGAVVAVARALHSSPGSYSLKVPQASGAKAITYVKVSLPGNEIITRLVP
ncbi:MAG: hypothetical protein GF398_02080 [Chitinivibrionales bacterium]|nr:hypothetical protein [Chitinivibrionales bacterium]